MFLFLGLKFSDQNSNGMNITFFFLCVYISVFLIIQFLLRRQIIYMLFFHDRMLPYKNSSQPLKKKWEKIFCKFKLLKTCPQKLANVTQEFLFIPYHSTRMTCELLTCELLTCDWVVHPLWKKYHFTFDNKLITN